MKIQILTAIVAISATGAAATVLDCGAVQTLYQDAECCGDSSSQDTCARSLSVASGSGLTLSGTGELSLVHPRGPAGADGADGADGSNGSDGSNGVAGPRGPGGETGAVGTFSTNTVIETSLGLKVTAGGATIAGHTGTKTVRTYFANTQGISCHGPGVNRISTVADCHLAYQSLIYDKSLEYPINNPQAAMAGSYIGVSSADPAGCLYQTQKNGNAANKYYFNTNTAGIGSTVGNIQLCSKDIVMDASSPSLGLEVSNAVVAKSFHAQSDQRIKKDITDADTGALLQKINALRMRNYGYIESAETTVGFIAQELEAVDDSFTSTTRRPIPDIRKTMDGAFSEGTLTLDLDGTEVAVGDTLKVELTGGAQELTVLSVENGQASVATDIEQPDGPVYVHGRIVDDFLVINKDRIMATAVGAVQELSTRLAAVEALNGKIAALEARLASLE